MDENFEEIIEKIAFYDERFPREELQLLIDNPEKSTPFLLDALRPAETVLNTLFNDNDYFLPFYALLMLAQFREPKAYPLVYEIFSSEAEKVDEIFDDFTTESLHRVLASVSGGDTSLINKLIEDENVYEYVRSVAIDAWVRIHVAGWKTREEIIAYFKTLFDLPAGEKDYIRASVIWSCLDLKAEELLPKIEKSYAEDKVDLMLMGDWDDFQRLWKDAKQKNKQVGFGSLKKNLVDDMIADLEQWACFREPEKRTEESDKFSFRSPEKEQDNWESSYKGTFVRETAKVGKNDPCPCGSGLKFKNAAKA
jgi:hypothetical protein